MIYNLKNQWDVPKFKDYVKKLIEQQAIVEVKKRNPNRTISQNKYLHLILGWFACEYGCSIEEAKIDFYKRECNKELFVKTRFNKAGKEVPYLQSTTLLTTSEMTLSIERFRNWSSSVAGIYIPAAREDQLLIYVEQEIERNKEFL